MPARQNTILMLHTGVVFEDEVIYLTGHVYKNCTFRRCTIIYRGAPGSLDTCTIEASVWHLDLLVHDANHWDDFMAGIAGMITRSLPKISN